MSTPIESIRLAREILSGYGDAPVGAGTNGYFTELNRYRIPAGAADLVCYSMNPQVHAFDDLSLMETLPMQAETVRNARDFSSAPVAASPITLRPRFNPSGAAGEQRAADQLPFAVDPRQATLFGAGWTLGSVRYLAEGGAASATYYETTGWRGVMEREAGPHHPAFPSVPGGVFPLYHVLADIGEHASGEVLEAISSDPLRVVGLALRGVERTRVMVANLTDEPQAVRIALPAHRARSLVRLNAVGVDIAARDPERFRASAGAPVETTDGAVRLDMGPYEYARLDLTA